MTFHYFSRRIFVPKFNRYILSFLLFSITLSSFADSLVNDSLIDEHINNAGFEKAIDLIEQYKSLKISNDQKIQLTIKTCEVYLLTCNLPALKSAINELNALTKEVQLKNPETKFQVALIKGKTLMLMGKNYNAIEWLRIAENTLASLNNKNPDDVAGLYMEFGQHYINSGDNVKAKGYFEKALDVLRKTPTHNVSFEIYCAANLADIIWYDEDTRSKDLILFCAHYLDKTNNPLHPSLLQAYLAVAEYYVNKNIPYTEKLLHNATSILKKYFPKNHYQYGILYFLKSKIKYAGHDFENALYYSNQSLEIVNNYPSLFPYKICNYTLMASSYYWYTHDYPKAINYCHMAIGQLENTHRSTAYFYYLIGLSNLRLGNQKQAISAFNMVISGSITKKTHSDLDVLSDVYLTMSQIASKEKDAHQAFYYLNQALLVSQKMGKNNERTRNIYFQTAKAYYYLYKDYDSALREIQKSIISGCRTFSDTTIESNPPISDIYAAYTLIESFSMKAYLFYMLYERDKLNLSHLETAMKCQEISVRLYERIIIGINEEHSGLNLVDLKVNALNNAVSYSTLLYLRTKNQKYAEKALEFAEKSKMQLLLIKTLKESNLRNSGIPESIILQEQRLNNSILETENLIALREKSGKTSVFGDQYTKTLSSLYDQRDELINHLEIDYPDYYRAKFSFHVAGIDKIQKMLKEHEVILEYQLLNTELIIFVISKTNFNIHYQSIDKEIFNHTTKLRQSVSLDPYRSGHELSFESFTASSAYLYNKLIRPVHNLISGKHLIIIPHNELTQIPFEILISKLPEKNTGDFKSLDFLIKEFPIIYAYSANLLLEKDQKKEYGRGTAIFLPDYSSQNAKDGPEILYQLKGAKTEVKAIKKLSNGKIYRNEQANEASFKRNSKGYGVLHIASHTLLDDSNPMLSCMVMTHTHDTMDDGNLYAYEISQMDLDAQLVVLSGCNTGFGVLRKSEGLISIARSFFYTGVQTIAYSLWPVADNAGSMLIRRFYREIKRNKPLDEAMRDAKLDFINHIDPVRSHPYYWANYMIAGSTESVSLTKHPLWAKTVCLLLLISGILFVLYKKIKS